jgi:hypothetical protein
MLCSWLVTVLLDELYVHIDKYERYDTITTTNVMFCKFQCLRMDVKVEWEKYWGGGICPKRNRTFLLKHLLISLQFNKTCLLQRTAPVV